MNVNHASTAPITDQILAIRDHWHTKRHPFFRAFGEGKLALKAIGRYQALHYHFVSYAVRSVRRQNIWDNAHLEIRES
jgi:hypothetical protein